MRHAAESYSTAGDHQLLHGGQHPSRQEAQYGKQADQLAPVLKGFRHHRVGSMVSIAPAAKVWAWSPFVVRDRRVLSSHCSTLPSLKRPKNVRDPFPEGQNAAGGRQNRNWTPVLMDVLFCPKRFGRVTGIVLKEGNGVNLRVERTRVTPHLPT